MVTLKMSDEDCKLLLKPLMSYCNKYRPFSEGGEFTYNPPIDEEEWLRLCELVDRLMSLKN